MIEKKNINIVIRVKIRKEFRRTKNNLNVIVHLKELYLSYRIAYMVCHTLRKTTILIIIKNLLPFSITHFWLKIHLIYLYTYYT